MVVPTSEDGYTPGMPRREDHEVHIGHVVALGERDIKYFLCIGSYVIRYSTGHTD